MISKKVLISMIVVIALVQFITANKGTPDLSKTRQTGTPRPAAAGKARTPATDSKEPGMNPDEVEAEKPNGIRHKILKPIKSFFWPMRFFWQKFKVLKTKVQKNSKKETLAAEGVSGEKN